MALGKMFRVPDEPIGITEICDGSEVGRICGKSDIQRCQTGSKDYKTRKKMELNRISGKKQQQRKNRPNLGKASCEKYPIGNYKNVF